MNTYTFHCLLKILALCAALHDQPVATLTAIHAGAMMADGAMTVGTHEIDPVARTVIGSRPTWSSMLGPGTAELVGETWLAERMRRSNHAWARRLWWIPQAVGIAANAEGAAWTATHGARPGPWGPLRRITDAPCGPGAPTQPTPVVILVIAH